MQDGSSETLLSLTTLPPPQGSHSHTKEAHCWVCVEPHSRCSLTYHQRSTGTRPAASFTPVSLKRISQLFYSRAH